MKSLNSHSGATLIEVMITALLLATSLLAMGILQTRSLQYNQAALMRSQANIQAYDMIDRIRINWGFNVNGVPISIETYNADYDVAPSGNDLATADVAAWRAAITRLLPGGKGRIACVTATRQCTIDIKWGDEQLFGAQGATNLEATNTFTYVSGI